MRKEKLRSGSSQGHRGSLLKCFHLPYHCSVLLTSRLLLKIQMEVAFSSFTELRRGCILYGGAPVLVMHLGCKMHLFPCEERCNRSIRMQVIRLHWLPGSHCIYAESAFLAFVTLCTRCRPNAQCPMSMCKSSSLGIALQRVIPSCSILGSSAFEGRGAAHNVYFLDEITTEDPLWPGWAEWAVPFEHCEAMWTVSAGTCHSLQNIVNIITLEHFEVMCILCCRGTCHSLRMLEGLHTRKGTRLCVID